MCQRAVGKTWGLRPKLTQWLYKAIIIPGFDCGALFWITSTTVKFKRKLLERVQRLALLMITSSHHSNGGDGGNPSPTSRGYLPQRTSNERLAQTLSHHLDLLYQFKGRWTPEMDSITHTVCTVVSNPAKSQ